MLVDKTGKIVFMGHPASRKIEEDIDNLLKGVALTGEGTSAKDEEAKEGDAAASKQPTDGELKKFEDDTKAWVSEAKSLAEGIDRAFLVLTCNTVFDVKNGSTKKEAACHTVILGGTKAKRDALEEETKKHSQNPNWKNERRVDGPP